MKIPLLAAFLATAVAQAQTPSFKEQQIDGEVGIGYGLAVADVNGDRQTDILLADSNVIVWYENPTWKKHVIAEKLTEKDHVCIAARDIDDGAVPYRLAGAWLRLGDPDTARAQLDRAIDLGYSARIIAGTPWLKPLIAREAAAAAQ